MSCCFEYKRNSESVLKNSYTKKLNKIPRETHRAESIFSNEEYLKGTSTYLKSGVSKSIVHVIKHANFQLCRARPDGVA